MTSTGEVLVDGNISSLPAEARIDMLVSELQGRSLKYARHIIAGDRVLAAISGAASELLGTQQTVRDRFADIIETRRTYKPEEQLPTWALGTMAVTAVHKQKLPGILNSPAGRYGPSHERPVTWRKYLETLWRPQEAFDPYTQAHDIYSHDMKLFSLDTIKIRRYATDALFIALTADEYPYTVRIRDNGSSRGDGLNMLFRGKPFSPIKVSGTRDNERAESAVSQLLLKRKQFGYGTNADIWPVDKRDLRRVEWFRANYLRPSDLHDPIKRQLLIDLERRHPAIKLLGVNLTNEEPGYDNLTYDIDQFFTVLYQIKPAEHKAILDRAANRSRFVIVQDYVRVNPKDPYTLQFPDSIDGEPFAYRTYVRDTERDEGYQEFIRWNDGSCTEMQPGHSDFARRLWAKVGIYYDDNASPTIAA